MSKKNKRDIKGFIYSTDPNFRFQHERRSEETYRQHKKLKISLDTRHRAGKAVTLIEGFVGTKKNLEQLGKKIKIFVVPVEV